MINDSLIYIFITNYQTCHYLKKKYEKTNTYL